MRSCVRSREVRLAPEWCTGSVRGLASEVATGRADLLPVLADALEEAGCDAAALLEHLREDVRHFDGCWVTSLLREMQFDADAFVTWAAQDANTGVAWYRGASEYAFEYIESAKARPGDLPLFRLRHFSDQFEQLPQLDAPFAIDKRMENVANRGLARLAGRRGLRVLGLRHDSTTRPGWEHLADVPDLRTLSVWGESVNDEVVTALTAVPQLDTLRFSRTRITNDAVRRFRAMPRLRELCLREHRHLTDAAAAALAGHPSLESLNIASVSLTAAGFDHLTEIPNLRSLTAFDCHVSDEALRRLPELKQLELLNLGNSKITDAAAKQIAALPNLRTLYLWQTGLTDASLVRLAESVNPEELYLGNVPITDEGLRAIAKMTRLRTLNLWATKVTDAGMEHLASLSDLRELNLGSTKVTNAGLTPLLALTRLQVFEANFSRIDEGARRKFMAALPNCGR